MPRIACRIGGHHFVFHIYRHHFVNRLGRLQKRQRLQKLECLHPLRSRRVLQFRNHRKRSHQLIPQPCDIPPFARPFPHRLKLPRSPRLVVETRDARLDVDKLAHDL